MFSRVLSCTVALCLVFGGFTAGQLIVSAVEITGYQNEAVVHFRNAGSGKYLNVHYGQDANNVNVYQWTEDDSDEQEFRLRYNAEEDCYLIGAMCSSEGGGRVLDIVKSGGQPANGSNVQIYNATDPVAQQWQFEYQGDGKFTIFPTANMYLVLTANGNSNGSGTGKSATSAGNVYLSEIPMASVVEYSPYQLWYIEEVEEEDEAGVYLKQTLPDGLYRIANGNNKYMTLYEDSDNNVCQMGDPGGLNASEWEKSRWRALQLWDVKYLYSGYYLISPYVDTTCKLAAFGDYESLSANVYVTYDNISTGTWAQRQQWKIIPSAGGAYRIVSKGGYNTQAVTVYQGNTANGTNIQMAPFYNAPGQRWTFNDKSTVCNGDSVGGHIVEYIDYQHKYKCSGCGREFASPAVEDYNNNRMNPQDRALIFALQRAALHEQLEGTNGAFVESCYRVIDMIRSSYDGYYSYDFCDAQGKYVSPVDYTYTATTVNTRVEITVEAEDTFGSNARNVIWTLGEDLPFPFNVFSSVLLDYFEDYEWCSLTEGLSIVRQAILEGALPDFDELETATTFFGVLNAIVDGSAVEDLNEEITIQISMQSPTGTHNFSGIYRVTDTQDHRIYVVKESHSSASGQANDYEANEIDCIYYDSENNYDIKPYDKIFDENM